MSNFLSWTLHMKVRDKRFDDARALMQEMVASTEQESGTLAYEWFLSADGRQCHIYERYVDSDAALLHIAGFNVKFAERFLGCFDLNLVAVYGDPTPEAKSALGGFKPVYLGNFGGFHR